MIISEPGGASGLVILSACGVGGIHRSPGAGRVVAELIDGKQPWIDPKMLSADRFSDTYAQDASLRARCEEIYAHQYHDVS